MYDRVKTGRIATATVITEMSQKFGSAIAYSKAYTVKMVYAGFYDNMQ